MTTNESLVREAFANQANWCAKLGSPFTARLMEGLGPVLDHSTFTGRTILAWSGPPGALGDSVPLRLAGALHAFVRRGRCGPGTSAGSADLAQFYPPNPLPDIDTLTNAVMAALADTDTDAEIAAWLEHPPQTNEVARSGILYPGLMEIAQAVRLPLSLFEIGASAGLNLIPDLYGYRFGEKEYGQNQSPVQLSPDWSGPSPGGLEPQIVSRRGCDRNPLDVTETGHRERLAAYVWPDQADRLARVEAAIGLARDNPPRLDRADAADWVDDVVCGETWHGTARVLFHSIAYQYFPAGTRQRIKARMQQAGERASDDAPLAWLAFEQFQGDGPRLSLRLWPGGGERVLAGADAHVRAIEWLE